MWEELKAGNFAFAARGERMSSKFNRALSASKELADGYKEKIGLIAKAKFRADWAEQQYQFFKKNKSKTETNTKKEKLKGKYLALNRICHKEGGGCDGMRAATCYA
eukprot:4588356-Pyramimonas_sp.AAC.1